MKPFDIAQNWGSLSAVVEKVEYKMCILYTNTAPSDPKICAVDPI